MKRAVAVLLALSSVACAHRRSQWQAQAPSADAGVPAGPVAPPVLEAEPAPENWYGKPILVSGLAGGLLIGIGAPTALGADPVEDERSVAQGIVLGGIGAGLQLITPLAAHAGSRNARAGFDALVRHVALSVLFGAIVSPGVAAMSDRGLRGTEPLGVGLLMGAASAMPAIIDASVYAYREGEP